MPVVRLDDPGDCRLDPYRELKRKNVARSSGRFIAEGRFVVERLIESPFPVESLLMTEERYDHLQENLAEVAAPVYVVPHAILRGLVGFDFHAGLMACGVRQPLASVDELLQDAPPRALYVACPRTTDRVNLGNIIRLCSAFGASALLLGSACADPFSRRVLRVSMGNVLRLPIIESDDLECDLDRLHAACGVERAALVLDETAMPLSEAERPARVALLLGNEGAGPEPEWVARCEHRWPIPMSNGTDSLNVAAAAAITLYQLTRL